MSIADEMAEQQRDISISEFFTKNRHLLGFDNPRKALLTTVKEAVDNSLDACEEARIKPSIIVRISKVEKKENRFVVSIEDNGPGIKKTVVPRVFGKLLYGSKFHRLKMSRGQQGIGISAAGMYGQLTSGKATQVVTRISSRTPAHYYEIQLNTKNNTPEIIKEKEIDWEPAHGTKVSIELEGRYQRGKQSVDEYLAQTAIANPHVEIRYFSPDGNESFHARASKEMPHLPKEIKPHPYGVELGMLISMLKQTEQKNLQGFLSKEFSRVSPALAKKIAEQAKLTAKTRPKSVAHKAAENLYDAIQKIKIRNPATDCLSPIGDTLVLKGLKREIDAEFYTSTTRPPAVYRGNPFQIEVGLAYGKIAKQQAGKNQEQGDMFEESTSKNGKTQAEQSQMRVLRFANRVPLLFQNAGCAITKAIVQTAWKNYGLSQSRGALPMGDVVCMVHMASVWVPFTSESKEAVAHYEEIVKEIKLAIQECGRKMGIYLRRKKKDKEAAKKKDYIKKFIPIIVEALDEILELPKNKQDIATKKLTDILERSRT